MKYFYKIEGSKLASLRGFLFLINLILTITQLSGCVIPPIVVEDTAEVNETMMSGVDVGNIQLTLDPLDLYEKKTANYLVLNPMVTENCYDKVPFLYVLDEIESGLRSSNLDIEIVDANAFINSVFPDGEKMLQRLYEPESMRLIKEIGVDYLLLIYPYKMNYSAIGPLFIVTGISTCSGKAEFSTIIIDLKTGIKQRRFDMKTEGRYFLVWGGLIMFGGGKEPADISNNIQPIGERMARAIVDPSSLEPVRVVVIGGLINNQKTETELKSD